MSHDCPTKSNYCCTKRNIFSQIKPPRTVLHRFSPADFGSRADSQDDWRLPTCERALMEQDKYSGEQNFSM